MGFVKASILRDNILSIRALTPSLHAEVRKRAQSIIETTEKAGRTDWLPIELDVRFAEIIASVVGVEQLRLCNVHVIMASIEGPILRPVLGAATRMFGIQPTSAFRFAKQAYSLVYKDAGTCSFTSLPEGQSGGVLEILDADPLQRDSLMWQEGLAGAITGLVQAVGKKGVVLPATVGNNVCFEVSWT